MGQGSEKWLEVDFRLRGAAYIFWLLYGNLEVLKYEEVQSCPKFGYAQ